MKPSTVILTLILLVPDAFATAQRGERLIYNGQTNEMYSTPLESYFNKEHPRPEELSGTSSGLWRGYIGAWRIVDGSLFLQSLVRQRMERNEKTWEFRDWEEEIPLSLIFKNQKPPILASWYSGVLRIPQGSQLRYVHMGFGSVFEKDLFITVDKGRVMSERLVDNKDGIGATRSTVDFQWVALGSSPIKDDGKWYDARLIRTSAFSDIMKSGTNFITRGIFFKAQGDEPANLWIPETPTTEPAAQPLNSLPEKYKGPDGNHVEIKAHFSKGKDSYLLHVDSIRQLKPGETMHHPDFKSTQPPIKPGSAKDQRSP